MCVLRNRIEGGVGGASPPSSTNRKARGVKQLINESGWAKAADRVQPVAEQDCGSIHT